MNSRTLLELERIIVATQEVGTILYLGSNSGTLVKLKALAISELELYEVNLPHIELLHTNVLIYYKRILSCPHSKAATRVN